MFQSSSRLDHSIDSAIEQFDQVLRTLGARSTNSNIALPSQDCAEVELEPDQRTHAAGLMRVNHTGEVCAQALYQGQRFSAHSDEVRESMRQAADEEVDHLAWCQTRLNELDSQPSLLNPLFYAGSFAIGAAAGAIGDKWSLGFVAETERQVVQHLDSHLDALPPEDLKSRKIVEQMKDDELRHATHAVAAGGADLPAPVRAVMTATSKIMTTLAYRF